MYQYFKLFFSVLVTLYLSKINLICYCVANFSSLIGLVRISPLITTERFYSSRQYCILLWLYSLPIT